MRDVALKGMNLPARVAVKGQSTGEDENLLVLRPKLSFSTLRLAVGDDPEVPAAGSNVAPASAEPVNVPVTVNGRLDAEAHAQYFRFRALKGQAINIEVNANRLGSKMDSVVDVLDAQSRPVERATVRAISETSTTLSDRDSQSTGIRLTSWAGMNVGDYILMERRLCAYERCRRAPTRT